ncbi:hypothetical protein GGX14DRAFT_512691 [Mycena pura]|uniref:LYC1 C-terminal domain-containing protein n=1 Tax=Mycena pura TaxID=153505 RepID=A0AAD6YQK4_9AGAR|nr:hypothetical protein GGX14DRAFT_512691 [Mycena pura]
MSVDLSGLSLFPATPQQTTEARRRNLHEWGTGLSLEEHLARDASQELFEGSHDGRFVTWVLAPRHDPQTLDFKCACETFKRTGLVVNTKGAASEMVTCYGIASVFTPPEKRSQGFAHHMMRLLHWIIADESLLPYAEFPAAWGAPPPKVDGTRNGRFSALWSDVGEFYSACGPFPGKQGGWIVRGASTTVWDVDASSIPARTSTDWTWLDDSGVSNLWEEDAEFIRQDMEKNDSPGISFTFLPTHGVASFQHRRLDTFLQRLDDPPQIWGVVSSEHSTYATWMIDPRPPAPRTLTVTRLRAKLQNLAEAVGKLLEVAKKHDVKRVEIWNLPAGLEPLAGNLGATTYLRKEHIPAFKWYGKEPETDVSWAFNERFCWC